MERSSRARTLIGGFPALLVSSLLLTGAGCGEIDSSEDVEQVRSAITGGWTTLTLVNGWTNFNASNAPAVGMVNGIITFRGALKGTNATSEHAFDLPAAFRPEYPDWVSMRVVMNGIAGGTLTVLPDNRVLIMEDGVPSPGANAKAMTSLDGASFDQSCGEELEPLNMWFGAYPFRLQGTQVTGAYVKSVNGYVRFQGWLLNQQGNLNMHLFTIPEAFRPGQVVAVPVELCTGPGGRHGRLVIHPSGEVYAEPEWGDYDAANCAVSLDGAFYSRTSSTTALTLVNGWHAYSARPVRVKNDGGVIRLQGPILGGTSTTITTLPVGMRPPTTVYLPAASGFLRGRISVSPGGTVRVDVPELSEATQFLSLDGVSFGI